MLHLYSTYTIWPLPLMSPKILSIAPVDPLVVVVGTTPAESRRRRDRFTGVGFCKRRGDLVGAGVDGRQRHRLFVGPVPTTSCCPTNINVER